MERSGSTAPNDHIKSDIFSGALGGVQNRCQPQERAKHFTLKFFLNIKSVDTPELVHAVTVMSNNTELQSGMEWNGVSKG